jgi:hypothetical protein
MNIIDGQLPEIVVEEQMFHGTVRPDNALEIEDFASLQHISSILNLRAFGVESLV